MGYREKIAWLALIGMAIGYLPFFAILQSEAGAGPPSMGRFLVLFAIASAVRVVIEIGGRLVLIVRLGREGREPPDERDRAIAARSSSFAYIVLLTGTIIAGVEAQHADIVGEVPPGHCQPRR